MVPEMRQETEFEFVDRRFGNVVAGFLINPCGWLPAAG
jgi:hypothetical protein